MKLIYITALTLFMGMASISVKAQQEVILKINEEDITKEDFESIFRKNNRDTAITRASLEEYMELFINFKLKVIEAEALGLDTAEKFQKELAGYRRQLARPYLTDTELLDGLVKEAYDHSTSEIRASHILIKCNDNSTPEDTLKAYNHIMDLRQRIVDGKPFDKVATGKDGSEDPSVKDNKGDLGYFSAFQMVYPFEQAAYNTPVGEVSMPVRTSFGYHLIYVTDKREARGEIKVAHIMIRKKEKQDSATTAANKNLIYEIHGKLLEGTPFDVLASQFSEDASSAKKGGELAWFGAGKMVEEFDEAAFALKNNGDFSEPIQTEYGWHIIKRLDYRPVPEFAMVEKELKNKVSRDVRSEKTRKSFIAKKKAEYNYALNTKTYNKLLAAADTSIFNGTINVSSKDEGKTLLSLNGKNYPVSSFLDYLKKRSKTKETDPKKVMENRFDTYVDDLVVTEVDSRLEEEHRDFRLLMNEYHDGILLFELTDQKVWSKAVKDSAGLEAFYAENKDKYMWSDRVNATLYRCASEGIAKKVQKMRKQGKTPQELKAIINKDSNLNVQFKTQDYKKGEFEYISLVPWEVGIYMIDEEDRFVVVEINEVMPPQNKSLEEARGLVTADYQNYLEQAWIEELRAKYTYQVNQDVLFTIH